MSTKLAAAASITLLLPQLSMSCQWTPFFRSNCTISKCPLKEAQWRGLGLIYLVVPITTFRYSGLTSRYWLAAPLESMSLTILVCPRQQAQMKPVHFFLLFSRWKMAYLNSWYLLFSWGISPPPHISFSWCRRLNVNWVLFCSCQSFPLPLPPPPRALTASPLPPSVVTFSYKLSI